MRAFLPWLLVLGALSACGPLNAAVGALVGVDAAVSVPVFGRTTGDLVASVIVGRGCSVVRLEQGLGYCRPREGPPEPPPFCTRSLGVVDCWADPRLLPGHPPPVADTPAETPEQAARRLARWPDL